MRLFLTKKSAQVIIFCLTLFGVFSFQNCSQHSFDVQKTTQKMDLSSTSSTSSSDQSVNTGTDQPVLVPQCSPQQIRQVRGMARVSLIIATQAIL